MSAIGRGFINPFRNKARALVVVVLLSIVTGFLALMVQASFASRAQVSGMEGRVRNLIELREAGARAARDRRGRLRNRIMHIKDGRLSPQAQAGGSADNSLKWQRSTTHG